MKLLLRVIVLFSALFAAAIGLIRAQPYDSRMLRAALNPADCAAPCFMGIRPGVTSGDGAYFLLQRHPWVKEVQVYPDFGVLAWTWSGRQPTWIDDSKTGVLLTSQGIVRYVRVFSHISLGDIWLMYDEPNTAALISPQGSTPVSAFSIVDAHNEYIVSSDVMCQRRFWQAAVQISVWADELSTLDYGSRLPERTDYEAFCR